MTTVHLTFLWLVISVYGTCTALTMRRSDKNEVSQEGNVCAPNVQWGPLGTYSIGGDTRAQTLVNDTQNYYPSYAI